MWMQVMVGLVFLHVVCCSEDQGAGRIRRQSDPTGLFSRGQVEEIVNAHNSVRRRESATDMILMEWNDDLAAEAQSLADMCVWTTRPKTQLHGLVQDFGQLVENVHVSSSAVDMKLAVEKWASETHNYRYDTAQCNKVCWHYTQVVWASSNAVGCGIRYCPSLENVEWGRHGGYILSCLYGPGGNVEGQSPYIRGDVACSNCSMDFPYCDNGLCSRRIPPSTTTPTSSDITSRTPESTTRTLSDASTTPSVVGSASRLCSRIGTFTTLMYSLSSIIT